VGLAMVPLMPKTRHANIATLSSSTNIDLKNQQPSHVLFRFEESDLEEFEALTVSALGDEKEKTPIK
jgi:hypothetical protein